MDPLSHALLGRTLSGLDRTQMFGRGACAALVLGSLAPDLDLVFAYGGWDRYLYVHQTGTHTIVASPVVALAVALTVRAFVRSSRFTRLWCAAWVGVVIGHLIFDLVSGSEMRILTPFVQRRFGPHWIAMADLLALSILIVGTIWGLRRPRQAAVWTLAGLVVLLGVKGWSQHRAEIVFARRAVVEGVRHTGRYPEAINGSLFGWRFFERDATAARAWQVSVLTGEVALWLERSMSTDNEILSRSLHVQAVRTFLDLADVPFARVERDGDRTLILWSDLRQCSAERCDLSFGADLDAARQPVREVIRIGPFEQTRIMSVPGSR
jgi:membrane-bound metal-dependent hydrolase YbcI (DUF457 family)